MKVSNGLKKFGDITEIPIDVDLFNVRLGESCTISLIVSFRTMKDFLTCMLYNFALKEWTLSIVLAETEFVFPLWWTTVTCT